MPRKVQRYSRLLDKLRATGGSFGDGEGEVQNFYRFLTGQRKINVENRPPSEAYAPVATAILPFSLDIQATPDASDRVAVTMTRYSYGGYLTRLNDRLSAAKLGWAAPDAENKSGKELNFFPALLKVTMTRSGAVTQNNKVSGVTGQTYKYTPSRTFSIPFGRTTTAVEETAKGGAAPTDVEVAEYKTVADSIRKSLTTPTLLSGIKSISFEPEVAKERKTTATNYTAITDQNTLGVSVN